MNKKHLQQITLVGLFFSFLFFVSCGGGEATTDEPTNETATIEVPEELSAELIFDTENSYFHWIGTKIGGEHYGDINLSTGKMKVENGTLTAASFNMDMSSITVTDIEDEEENGYLRGHLLNPDFFNVDTFPTATLVMTSFENGNLTGDLTIKDITNSVSFPVTITTDETTYMMSGTMTVDRALYDIRYASTSFFDDLGDKVIHDEFTVDFELKSTIAAE